MTASARRRAFWRDLVLLFGGSLISALALDAFYLPIRLTMGGISGVASIIYQLTDQGRFLPFGVIVLLLNIPLLILGWRAMSARFIIRTLSGTLVYSLLIDLLDPVFRRFYENYLSRQPVGGISDPLLFCIVGGVLYGVGLGMIFRGAYTTGGTDILALVVRKRWPWLSIGRLLMLFDGVIVLTSALVYRDDGGLELLMALYSLIAMYLSARSIDLVLEGFAYRRATYIVSDAAAGIGKRIISEVGRGCTLLQGQGLYTGEDRAVLICVHTLRQLPQIKAIVLEQDARAFMFVVDAREVLGEGFAKESPF